MQWRMYEVNIQAQQRSINLSGKFQVLQIPKWHQLLFFIAEAKQYCETHKPPLPVSARDEDFVKELNIFQDVPKRACLRVRSFDLAR